MGWDGDGNRQSVENCHKSNENRRDFDSVSRCSLFVVDASISLHTNSTRLWNWNKRCSAMQPGIYDNYFIFWAEFVHLILYLIIAECSFSTFVHSLTHSGDRIRTGREYIWSGRRTIHNWMRHRRKMIVRIRLWVLNGSCCARELFMNKPNVEFTMKKDKNSFSHSTQVR